MKCVSVKCEQCWSDGDTAAAVQVKHLNSQLEQETQKRTGLQSELKTAQQQIMQLKATEKQLTKVLAQYSRKWTLIFFSYIYGKDVAFLGFFAKIFLGYPLIEQLLS